ncbi:MAG TPA: site-2 protease family protein [Gemmataceae bacterium]|jgi:stage IV sporulation protein FB|nr:site-2 protease family protein [Gemmataceae bacterium]
MLAEPQPSPYDLHFELFGTRVRVHPFFWLFTAFLGWSALERGFLSLVIWIVAVFFSILLHEFGHIWMGKLFGSDGYIVLYSFGGLAVGANDSRRRWQRILVLLAGPGIQLAFYVLLWLGEKSMGADHRARLSEPIDELLHSLKWINLVWPLMNLLPVWPLDGGQICRELCSIASPQEALRISLMISGCTATAIALNGLYAMNHDGHGLIPHVPDLGSWGLILFALLAVQSFQLMAMMRREQPWHYEGPDDRLPWER